MCYPCPVQMLSTNLLCGCRSASIPDAEHCPQTGGQHDHQGPAISRRGRRHVSFLTSFQFLAVPWFHLFAVEAMAVIFPSSYCMKHCEMLVAVPKKKAYNYSSIIDTADLLSTLVKYPLVRFYACLHSDLLLRFI